MMAHRRLGTCTMAFFVVVLLGIAPFVGSPLGGMSRAAADPTPVNGGGSGFAGLEIQQWQADTARKPYNLSVNYSSQSSGVGRINFASGLYDYGVSDITYQPEEGNEVSQIQGGRCKGATGCFKYVPVSAGGLSFMYNLTNGASRIMNLQLTPAQVCGIFTQQIKKWNDPSLLTDNPELGNNSDNINVVTRSDAAGESFVLSQYCIATAPTVWQNFVNYEKTNSVNAGPQTKELFAGEPISDWPPQLSAQNSNTFQESGADAVANAVADPQQGKDAITYDAAGYALVRSFPVASVSNVMNPTHFVQPTEPNVDLALAYAQPDPSTQTFVLNFLGSNPNAYFPSTYSYAIVQTTGEDAGKGSTIGQFLCYAVGKGQTIAPDLRYARLSSQIVAISVAAITAIPGAPSAAACTAGAPAAPSLPGVGAAGASDATGAGTAAAAAGTSGTGSGGQSALQKALAASAATSTTLTEAQKRAADALAAAKKAGAAGGSTAGGSDSTGDALWYLLLGALVCAIGVGVTAGARRDT